VEIMPAQPKFVQACLSRTLHYSGSVSAVQTLASAIAYEHRLAGFDSPTTSSESLSAFIQGVRKVHGGPRNSVEPLTVLHLKALIDHLYSYPHGDLGQNAPLKLWRTVWLSSMTFYGLCRFNEIQSLVRSDIDVMDSPERHLLVNIKHSKTDLYSEGNQKLIAANSIDPKYCPVNLTVNYLRFLGPTHGGSLLPACAPGYPNRANPKKPVIYTNALEDFRSLLTQLGFNGNKFGLHSGKRGGATEAADNGMSKDDLQRFGNWSSDSMPSRYVDLSIPKRLEMAKKLQVKKLSQI